MQNRHEPYKGREQSFIKHQFLTKYLKSAAYKILQGRSPIFNFVDAFAGPWRVFDGHFSDASFDQALQTLEAVRQHLSDGGISGLKVRFYFCEKRRSAFDELYKYAESRRGLEIRIFHGLFEDQLAEIAEACRDGFTFTFIDPTGWNIRSEEIFHFLRDRRGEFLLNFMAEHVNRHAEYSQVSASFRRFLADPSWSDEFKALPEDWSNEQRVLYLLRKKIKLLGAAKYVPDFPILKPTEERIKMRLILGTNSPKGLAVFRDVQEKVERQEIETRNKLRNQEGKQVSLFDDDEISAMAQSHMGIGCRTYQRQAELRIDEQLAKLGSQRFSDIAIDILEHVPIRLPQLKKLLVQMNDRGLVRFELPSNKRVPEEDTLVSRK